LWQSGTRVGRRYALVGEGRFVRKLAAEMRKDPQMRSFFLPAPSVQRAIGRNRVERLAFDEGGKRRELSVSLVAYDAPLSASVELLLQAGASVVFEPARGYLPELDASGRAAPALYAAGSCAGAHDSAADGARVARALATVSRSP
jgi:hypothetical protein